MLFPNMLLWLSLPGLIQHWCSASIIRNIVSVCIASFSALGSFFGRLLVWFGILKSSAVGCSSGALQGDGRVASAAAQRPVALWGALHTTAGTKADVILPKVWIRMED